MHILLIFWQLSQWIAIGFVFLGLKVMRRSYTITRLFNTYAVDAGIKKGAFSLGPFIFGPMSFTADEKSAFFMHEFGHSLQSRLLGPFYLPIIGLPSLLSAALFPKEHNERWFEVWANRLAISFSDTLQLDNNRSKHDKLDYGLNTKSSFSWKDIVLVTPTVLLVVLLFWITAN